MSPSISSHRHPLLPKARQASLCTPVLPVAVLLLLTSLAACGVGSYDDTVTDAYPTGQQQSSRGDVGRDTDTARQQSTRSPRDAADRDIATSRQSSVQSQGDAAERDTDTARQQSTQSSENDADVSAFRTILMETGNDNEAPSDGSLTFETVSAGWGHTCGVKSDGSLACWGGDGSGKATLPGGDFKTVSSGKLHTCRVRSDGSVVCWGSNQDDIGLVVRQVKPPEGDFKTVSAGENHTCG